jgi:hypothetical protein
VLGDWEIGLRYSVTAMTLLYSVQTAFCPVDIRGYFLWAGRRRNLGLISDHVLNPPGLLYPKDAWNPFPGGKQAGAKDDLSLIFNGEVKNAWSYIFVPHVFMAWCLIIHRDNFIFYTISIFHREYIQ